jgi:predicted nucleic acid-binding protein
MTVVLDAWAIIALVDDAPSAARVDAVLEAGSGAMCTVNLGEVAYQLVRRRGDEARGLLDADVIAEQVRRIEPDWALVRRAAAIKARGRVSNADAFCVATAQRLDAPLWTGDPEIIALAGGTLDVVDLRHTP